MDLQSDSPKDDRLANDRGRFLRAASKIMNEDAGEEIDALESLDSLECAKCRKCPHCNSNTAALSNTIRLTMLEINEIKERHRERRHREFIALLENYLGGDKLKSPDVLRNIKIEDLSINNANNESERMRNESSQISRKNKESSAMPQPHTTIQKRLSDINHVGVPPKKAINLQNSIKTEPLKNNTDTKVSKTSDQQNEFVAMRQKMLEMQRRKMEDRERKKGDNRIP